MAPPSVGGRRAPVAFGARWRRPRRLWRRLWAAPMWQRALALYLLVTLALLGVERGAFALARVPLQFTTSARSGELRVDGQRLALTWANDASTAGRSPTALLFEPPPPLTRELQIDGTDEINNFTTDRAYLDRIASTPYYRFQAWMRGDDSYSAWRDINVRAGATGRVTPIATRTVGGTLAPLPVGGEATIAAVLERPEYPTQVLVLCANVPCAEVIFDRNDRYILAHTLNANGTTGADQRIFYPTQPLPFAAEVVDELARVGLWALALLGALALLHAVGVVLLGALATQRPSIAAVGLPSTGAALPDEPPPARVLPAVWQRALARLGLLDDRWQALATLTVAASLAATLCVALAQFHALPHILDASAYYFQAKIFASGQLSAPMPRDLAAFQGPFMVATQGRWFAQYAPAPSALLAVGLLLHVPWLVEPLLGAVALWGIYRIGRLLFSGFEAWLALLLAALSPFYTYIAAAYLSHAIALCCIVYLLLGLLHFGQNQRQRDLLLAAGCLGVLLLTRELSALLVGSGALLAVAVLQRGVLWRQRAQVAWMLLPAAAIVAAFILVYLGYDWLQTGSPYLTPRLLFSPADRYGFGEGIGFYGRHTVAAGCVVLHQLLTAELIDLYGWPFYLTLALVPLALLRRWSQVRWDVGFLLLAALLTVAQMGYFYHGIYLGPRYLYDTLPFITLLSARGVTGLAGAVARARLPVRTSRNAASASWLARALTGATLALLLGCNVFFYLPRQVQVHTDFTGLPAYRPVDVQTLYAFQPTDAVIVTDDATIYNYVLWPLNDPNLRGPTLYAFAPTPALLAQVRADFPHRTFYTVSIAPNGHVAFVRMGG